MALQRQQAIRTLAPVRGRGHPSARSRFYDGRDNSASTSLLGLGVVLVGVLIALWWTTGVQVDLSVLRGPAVSLNHRDADRPTTHPGATSAPAGTAMAPEVQAVPVVPPPIDSRLVPTAVVPASNNAGPPRTCARDGTRTSRTGLGACTRRWRPGSLGARAILAASTVMRPPHLEVGTRASACIRRPRPACPSRSDLA